jgi:hypothetical protein
MENTFATNFRDNIFVDTPQNQTFDAGLTKIINAVNSVLDNLTDSFTGSTVSFPGKSAAEATFKASAQSNITVTGSAPNVSVSLAQTFGSIVQTYVNTAVASGLGNISGSIGAPDVVPPNNFTIVSEIHTSAAPITNNMPLWEDLVDYALSASDNDFILNGLSPASRSAREAQILDPKVKKSNDDKAAAIATALKDLVEGITGVVTWILIPPTPAPPVPMVTSSSLLFA